jgi:hypothetical protein
MNIGRPLVPAILRVICPRPTVRWRLTLLYSVLFLLCGTALLAITYGLFARLDYSSQPKPTSGPRANPASSAALKLAVGMSAQRGLDLPACCSGRGSRWRSWRPYQAS